VWFKCIYTELLIYYNRSAYALERLIERSVTCGGQDTGETGVKSTEMEMQK